MKPRIFNTLSLISAVLLACTIFLWAWSLRVEPHVNYLSFRDGFHVSVWNGHSCFFNNKEYGPYLGGTIALLDSKKDKEEIDRFWSERRAFGPTFGVYYRYFHVPRSGTVIWTLCVSLLYPVIAFAMLPVVQFWKLPVIWLRKWRRARRLRLACDADFGPGWQMLGVIRLYWRLGALGAAAYLVAAIGIGAAYIRRGGFPSWESLGQMAICCIFAMAFLTSTHVAHRLAKKPEGMLPYARLVGIILATAYFPILTIPGIICVQRVTRDFAAYCESLQAGTGK